MSGLESRNRSLDRMESYSLSELKANMYSPIAPHRYGGTDICLALIDATVRIITHTKLAVIEVNPSPLTTSGKKTEKACPGMLAQMLKNKTYHSFQSFAASIRSRFESRSLDFSTPSS